MSTVLSAKKDKTTLAAYAVLLKQIRQAINTGKDRAAQAVERELVLTKWDTGKLILEHILQHQDRANYGDQVLEKLSKDLATSSRELRYMVEFARTTPIRPHASKLSWDKLRDLLSVNEDVQRVELTRKASQAKWSRTTLRGEIKKLKTAKQITVTKAPEPEHLQAKRGVPGVYRIVDWKGQKAYDLGFSTYYVIQGKPPRVKEPAEDELFTYEAEIDAVFDADTLWADIHLGFGIWTHQKLRLRGIDAPEITTTEGQAAKKFLTLVIARSAKRGEAISKKILITSTKSDKYDRYLADIYVPLSLSHLPAGKAGHHSAGTISDKKPDVVLSSPHRRGAGTINDKKHDVVLSLREEPSDRRSNRGDYIYINQLLLDKGFAVKGFE